MTMCATKLNPIRLTIAFLALIFSLTNLHGQVTGAITGTVKDPSAAVVPNATVTITNSATSVVARTVATNSAGIYVAEALPVGTYEVAVQAEGFRRALRSGIALNVADRLAVDFTLQLGPTTQTVEVTAAPPILETESGELSQVVSTKQITEIPVLGRNFLLLQQLVPGASRTGPDELGKGFYSSRAFAINGLNDHYTGYSLDGVQNTDMGNQTSTLTNPGPDTLAEFKVLTSNYSSRYGTAGGANLLAVTKSGTREFHGNVYEFLRNDKLNAADFFLNKNNQKKSKFRYNDYGYSLGGPFYIPNHYNTEKNKTFFFWSHEWIKQRTAAPIVAATPTQAMRSGDFSGFAALRNPNDPVTGKPLTDPSGAPCVTGANQISSGCINKNVALLLQQDFPLPNAPGFFNFIQGAGQAQDWWETLLRVDQNISGKLKAFVRYIQDSWHETDPTTQWSGDSFPTIHSAFNIPSRNIIGKLSMVINPTLLNEISYNYASNYPASSQRAMTILGATQKPAGYTAKQVFNQNTFNFVPDMAFSRGWGGISALWGPWWAHHNISQLTDDLSKQTGHHSLVMGATGQFSITPVDSQTSPSSQGRYFFDGSSTGEPIADALLGLPLSYSELQGRRQPYYNYHQFEAYFQDDWKVSQRLTLNLGIRYFYIPHVYSDAISAFRPNRYDPSRAVTVNPDGTIVPGSGDLLDGIVVARQNGIPRGLTQNYHDTLAPRFGFAWDPLGNGKTVIRGGYGVGYYRIEGNDVYRLVGNPPFSRIATFFRPPFDDPSAGTAAPLRPLVVNSLDPIYRVPMVQNWSFGVQRELSPNMRVSAAYVGSRGTHLDFLLDLNQPGPVAGFDFDPRIACTSTTPVPCTSRISTDSVRPFRGYSALSTETPVGNSIYHSLQATVEKRVSRGLTFNAVYTWSKTIGLGGATGLGASAQNIFNIRADRGPAAFDRTHIFDFNYVYELPFGKGLKGPARAILDGWETTGNITLQSGFALTPFFSSSTQGLASRPNRVAGVAIQGLKTAQQWVNANAFAAPPFGHFGNAGRGVVRGPGTNNFDLGFFKNNKLSERANLQFRVEMFNAFNHTNFNSVFLTFGSAGFGTITSAHNPRIVQLGLKLLF